MSLYLKQMEVGPMGNFVYLVGDGEKREVCVVDPAWQIDTILRTAQKENLKIVGAMVTHGHFDHCNGLDELLLKADIPVYVQKDEADFVKSFGAANEIFGAFPEDNLRKVSHGEKLMIGDIEITFLHTPGHTPGSQCFWVKDNLVSGDTLFVRGCGRCDLPGGDAQKMYESLTQTLLKLPDQTILYPGHNYADEPSAAFAVEKKRNPYLVCSSLDSFLSLVS